MNCFCALQQNLGSLVRSAYFLGAAGVLCCAKNSAPLSPAVAKASSGALEMLPLHSCSNLMRTLQAAGDAGWLVLGAPALVRLRLSGVIHGSGAQSPSCAGKHGNCECRVGQC